MLTALILYDLIGNHGHFYLTKEC